MDKGHYLGIWPLSYVYVPYLGIRHLILGLRHYLGIRIVILDLRPLSKDKAP
jgi:hypothetical protein